MSATRPVPLSQSELSSWGRLHAELMPDYNGPAAAYWWTVVLLGGGVCLTAIDSAFAMPQAAWGQIIGATVLAMVTGLVPVRIPRSTNSFTAGEIFIFLLLLTHGPLAATIAAAAEAAVATWRTSKRTTSRIASPAMAAIAMCGTGSLLQLSRDQMERIGFAQDAFLLLGTMVFAVSYFLLNTLLMTAIPRLKRAAPFSLEGAFSGLGWLALAYVANAWVATFLYLGYRQSGVVIVIAALPVIAILLMSGQYHFRREEAKESVRAAREAEAEQLVRHSRELQTSERRFHSAFTHASIGMALVAFDGRIRQANLALGQLLGLRIPDVEGTRLDFARFASVDGRSTLADELVSLREGRVDSLSTELRTQHADGADIWIAAHCSFFSEPDSAERWLILQLQDITARHRAQADLHYIAFHDDLTGLPNRQQFHEHLQGAIDRSRTGPASEFGVMFLDFDRFKLINDSMGHTRGDEFLVQVSRRIEENVRPGDVVARLGGDEFAILAVHESPERAVVALADRMLVALSRPFLVGGVEIMTSASIGITFSSVGYDAPEDVLRDADIAMYKAKAAGKARYALFDASLHTEVARRLRMEGDLRRALSEGELFVQYQPLHDLGSGALLGFEALARWRHPEFGLISPASFIPIAEESGSMVQLTDFVLRQACRSLRRWQEMAPQFAELSMHVNIAGNDIDGDGLVGRVTHALVQARLGAEHLTIELTENILMERLDASMAMLDRLHQLGIALSVDDFGTGYSSLSHLSNLPIDSLKIDMSFVRKLQPGSKEAAVIRAIVLLGKSLGKQVIAEGIESQAQLDQLRDLGCDIGQGFFLSRPLDGEAVDALLGAVLAAQAMPRRHNGDAGVRETVH